MAHLNKHRPAVEWLEELSKAKNTESGMKPKVTLQDLQERMNDPNSEETSLIPTSPKSIQACFLLGIDPIELQYHPLTWYKLPGESEEITQTRYEKCEYVRQERMRSLMDRRKDLIDQGWGGNETKKDPKKRSAEEDAAESSMVEHERQRLEALQRRQTKELEQMVHYEVQRKELQAKQAAKMAELDRRQEALQRQKRENEALWQQKQREIELQKLKEEEDLERQMKNILAERHRREREMQLKEQEDEKRRKKEAYKREMERRQKAEDARRETEAILAKQADATAQRKLEMERKDAERAKRLVAEAKQLALMNAEKRKKADERIASALAQNVAVMEGKRNAMHHKESANEHRRQQLDQQRRRDEEAKRLADIRKEQERQDKFTHAYQLEEMRKQQLRQRAEEKERALAELALQRKKEHDIKRVNSEFELKLRLDKVDALQKTHLFQRQQLLDKIMKEYEDARKLMQDRANLQQKRKMANMTASLNRQSMVSAMDTIRGKDIDNLASGRISIHQLIKRPNTAAH